MTQLQLAVCCLTEGACAYEVSEREEGSANFAYEVEAVMQEDDGHICMCEESEADFWGVYERPTEPDEHGGRLATWVADFARKEDAIVFQQLMQRNSK